MNEGMNEGIRKGDNVSIHVNDHGQIIAEFGAQWYKYSTKPTLWWTNFPYGYRIKQMSSGLWRLYRERTNLHIANTQIYIGHTPQECMRVFEIYQAERGQ